MTINEIQDSIIEEFSEYDDWMDKYQLLIDLGNEQEPLEEQYKNESNLIEGCQSRVWLQADLTDEGKIHFQADALLQRIFPTQGLNPGLLHCRQILYQLSHKGSPESCLRPVNFPHAILLVASVLLFPLEHPWYS